MNFDTEARLPKYMAQCAAELLIEKSGLDLNGRASPDQYAAQFVDFLYTTEKRQHLANWMKKRFKGGEVMASGTRSDVSGDENDFTNLFGSVKRSKPTCPDHYEFRVVVNKCFPCRTGTLTCFMLKNNIARIVFAVNDVNSRCQLLRKSIDANNAYKVVKILFILELVDDWEDIQTICDVA